MTDYETIQGEINALKSLLADSNSSIMETLEGLLSCTSATGIINFLKEQTEELSALVQSRVAWRAKIKELTAQLEAPSLADEQDEAPDQTDEQSEAQ